MVRHINKTPKRHIHARKDVILLIDHQNWSTSATCDDDEEAKERKKET